MLRQGYGLTDPSRTPRAEGRESTLSLRGRGSKSREARKAPATALSRASPRLQLISRELQQGLAAGCGGGMSEERSRPRPLWRSWERRGRERPAARTRR